MRLEGKTAIVIGAGSGIGHSIAIGFAKEGAKVAAADVNISSVSSTVEQILAQGGEAFAIGVDVNKKQDLENLLREAENKYQRIDIFVYSPGVTSRFPFIELPEEEWDRIINTNLKGMFLGGQLVARHMIKNGGGSIINVTSQLADVAARNIAHYLTSKGGGKMLTKAMALELANYGIRVNALAPGVTNTNINRIDNPEGLAHRMRTLPHIPLGRAAEPDEMVSAAVFMASDESSYMTGATLVIDGGYQIV